MNRLWLLVLLLYLTLILFVSTRPNLQAPGPQFAYKDKFAHVGEYFVMGLLVAAAFGGVVRRPRYAAFMLLVAACVSFAAVDEMVQSHVPGRYMDVFDWVADFAGSVLGVGLFLSLKRPEVERE